jgi:hypothetical protein
VPSVRYEHKFLVPERFLDAARRCVEPFVGVDGHATHQAGHTYTVRNIYFDDSRLSRYAEKEAGLEVRAKPRLRGYNEYVPGAAVFLEVKRRNGLVGTKDRAMLPFDRVAELFDTGDVEGLVEAPAWLPESRASARHFLFHIHRGPLWPVLLEVYEREPYVGLYEPSLRVTFDRQVRSALYPRIEELFTADGTRPSFRGMFILEVKHDATFGFPNWLRRFVADHGLVREALSKYWTCVTDWRLARPDLRVRTHVSALTPSTHRRALLEEHPIDA